MSEAVREASMRGDGEREGCVHSNAPASPHLQTPHYALSNLRYREEGGVDGEFTREIGERGER